MTHPAFVLATRQQDPGARLVQRVLAPARQLLVRALGRLRSVRPEAWFGLLLGLLLLAFVIALFLQPTVGRGGR